MNFKYLIISFLALLTALNINAQKLESFTQKTDAFFKTVVLEENVNYSFIQKNRSSIDELSALISEISPEELSPEERKSFLINAYNLLVIKEVINNYPITSTQKVNGFFEKIKHNVGGHVWTLNQIENDQIRAEFKDPRVHFVLSCAAVSCPPVANFAYTPEKLEEQLEEQTRKAINNPNFIYQKNGKNYISTIFKWYKSDFAKSGGAIEFINQYRAEKLPLENRSIFYPYDWILNDTNVNFTNSSDSNSFIQTYTPSKLLKKGQLELQLYNNLYTQTAFRNNNRKKVDLNQRQSYFTGLINIIYGINDNQKWNVGLDINLRSVRLDEKDSSPIQVLSFRSNDSNNRTAISTLGPVVKFAPFKSSKLSIKSAMLFPLVKDGESDERDAMGNSIRPWFDWNRITWWNQLFFDQNIGLNWQLFLEADLLFRFAKPAKNYINNQPKQDLLDTPVSAFLSYFLSEKSTVYTMLQYSPQFGFNKTNTGEKVTTFHAIGDYAQAGIGFKYQILQKLGLEISYTNFFTSYEQGAGNTFNLGIRYIN